MLCEYTALVSVTRDLPPLQVDPSAGGEYAELCVHLYADYCPQRLMDFLTGSQTYPLEAALEVAEQRGMVDEQVWLPVLRVMAEKLFKSAAKVK